MEGLQPTLVGKAEVVSHRCQWLRDLGGTALGKFGVRGLRTTSTARDLDRLGICRDPHARVQAVIWTARTCHREATPAIAITTTAVAAANISASRQWWPACAPAGEYARGMRRAGRWGRPLPAR